MTAIPASPRITELRELFRNLAEFRLTYELTGMQEIRTPYGNTWSLWDLEYLLQATAELNLRQRQAIQLCLVHNVREADAAEMMGVSRTNPVGMYATLGLQRLLDMIDMGELIRFNRPRLRPEDEISRREKQLEELVEVIRSKLIIADGDCWLFPNRGRNEPRLLLRSMSTYVGYRTVSPMHVLWLAEIGPVPEGCRVAHSAAVPRVAISCSNPRHGELIQSAERKAHVQRLAEQYIRSLGRTA